MKLSIDKNCYFLIPTKKNPTPDDALAMIQAQHYFNKRYIRIGILPAIQILEDIRNFLSKIIIKEKKLHNSIPLFQVGREWNFAHHNHNNNKESPNHRLFFELDYWLFSICDIETFMYNFEDKIIIEIVPCYKWDTIDLEKLPAKTIVPTFEEFMQNYNPIAIHEISKETAQKWIKQADKYIKVVEAQYPEWCQKNKDSLFYLKHDA